MTGFIKPEEIYEAQKMMVNRLQESDTDYADLSQGAKEFLEINPVTKKKESEPFRKVNGVWVTESDFEEAERRKLPKIELLED